MLFVNRCTWAHVVATAADLIEIGREELLSEEEMGALDGRRSPHGVIIQELE